MGRETDDGGSGEDDMVGWVVDEIPVIPMAFSSIRGFTDSLLVAADDVSGAPELAITTAFRLAQEPLVLAVEVDGLALDILIEMGLLGSTVKVDLVVSFGDVSISRGWLSKCGLLCGAISFSSM